MTEDHEYLEAEGMADTSAHIWAMVPQTDVCQCVRCGMTASNTAIVCGHGTPSPEGWGVGEFSVPLPGCDENDLDSELTRLLDGGFDG